MLCACSDHLAMTLYFLDMGSFRDCKSAYGAFCSYERMTAHAMSEWRGMGENEGTQVSLSPSSASKRRQLPRWRHGLCEETIGSPSGTFASTPLSSPKKWLLHVDICWPMTTSHFKDTPVCLQRCQPASHRSSRGVARQPHVDFHIMDCTRRPGRPLLFFIP